MNIKLNLVLLTCLGIGLAVIPAISAKSAADVLALAKEASGGTAWDGLTSAHTVSKLALGGMTGKVESWEDLRTGRFLARVELGPLIEVQGSDGRVLWEQDSSKQVRIEEGADARLEAVNEAYRRTMAYWFPERGRALIEDAGEKEDQGRSFRVVRIIPQSGRVFEIWVDPTTHLFDHVVEKGATETRTTFFSDYRRVEGVLVPFASRSTNGQARYDQIGTVERVEFNVPLKDEMFRVPPPPAPDFEMAGGRTSTTLPFALINNHIYLDVRLDGQGPFRFLCDTGGANIVTPEVAKELGLKAEGAIEGTGVGEKSEDVGFTKVGALLVGDTTLKDQVFAVFDLSSLRAVEDVPVQGLIGYEVFKRFIVAIDYEHSRLTLTAPSAFAYEGKGTVVPFKFDGTIPEVQGEIDGLPGKFHIDTGSRSSLTILAPFAQSHDLKTRYGAKVEAVTGWGVGGAARGLVARAKVLKLGNVSVDGPLIELSLQSKGSFIDPYVAGNVGAGILKRFNIIFDYGRQQMIFEPNANSSHPEGYDRAGMWLNMSGSDAFLVVDVTAASPAAEAGLKAGDMILSLDGRTPAELPLWQARAKLRSDPVGTRVRLLVRSDGREREVELVLRDLV
jgi:hypothetical protein